MKRSQVSVTPNQADLSKDQIEHIRARVGRKSSKEARAASIKRRDSQQMTEAGFNQKYPTQAAA